MMARRYIVAGAPCSGKSSFVRSHRRDGELIYDYDTLHQALSGRGSHEHDPDIRPYVLAARDSIFDELEVHRMQNAWIITSTRKNDELLSLRDRFEADVIFLAVDQSEAHRRCDVDQRPAEWHDYIDNWFKETDIDKSNWPMPKQKKEVSMAKRKIFRAAIKFKADSDETGEFAAEFATLNVIDLDGDVTEPGAFQDGQETLIEAWNHGYFELPVGKGVIRERDNKAIIEGRFFMDTMGGVEHYRTVKNIGTLQEWSYTFDILESGSGEFDDQEVHFLRKLDVWGVAPVQRGAGIDTRTLAIKRQRNDSTGVDGEGGASPPQSPPGGGKGEDSEPSGPRPEVIGTEIDILLMEA
jgi:hypothetical protein